MTTPSNTDEAATVLMDALMKWRPDSGGLNAVDVLDALMLCASIVIETAPSSQLRAAYTFRAAGALLQDGGADLADILAICRAHSLADVAGNV